jgi:hypothetical protein
MSWILQEGCDRDSRAMGGDRITGRIENSIEQVLPNACS